MAYIPKLPLLLLCTYHTLVAHAGHDLRSYKVGSPESATVSCTKPRVSPSSGSGVVTVALHHRHGPCSPAPSTTAPTWEEMLRSDQLRTAYIVRKFSGVKGGAGDVEQSDATMPTKLPTKLGSSFGTAQYVITVGIGSPAVSQTMFIDTGSDVSWVQCKPCSRCHAQKGPLFDPRSSSTYSPLSCNSTACVQLRLDGQGNGCSPSQQCQYIINYVDHSNTSGTYSSDTLKLGSNVVKNFQFGCTQSEKGNLLMDQTAGLMGLGGGNESLVSQTAATFGKAFSYCLPPTADTSGFLTLGVSVSAASSGFVETRMFQRKTNYFVRLEAIRVGDKQLNIPTSVFSGMSLMDSGTIITRLPPTAYSALTSAFKAAMKQYPLAPAMPDGLLDTCFNFSGQSNRTIASVALVFSGNVVVNIAQEGIIVQDCLAFAKMSADTTYSFIGNIQQRTFEVMYDVAGGTVGFKAGAC